MSKARCATLVRISSKLFAGFIIALLLANAGQGAEIAWSKDLQKASLEAAKQRKPMLVMVGARWCGFCHKMLDQTFANPALVARINARFVPVLIDFDEQPALFEALHISSLPTVLVMTSDRHILGRQIGFQSVAQLDTQLASIKTSEPKSPLHSKSAVSVPTRNQRDTLTAAKEFSAGR